jgi:outer membrane protein TolC
MVCMMCTERFALFLLAVAFVFSSRPAVAEPPLDCDAVVAAVMAQDPALRAARAAVDEAQAGASMLQWLSSPEMRARSDASTRNDQVRAGVRWAPPAPGVATAKAAAAQARETRATAEADALAARTAAAVRADFAALWYAQARRQTLTRLVDAATAHVSAARTQAAAGVVSALAEQSAMLEVDDLREQLAQARAREEIARAAMQRWIDQPIALDGSMCAAAVDAVPDDAVAQHPDVRAARGAATAAEFEAKAATRDHWVWPSFLQVTWVRELDDRSDGVLLEAGIPLPISTRETEAARARLQVRQLDLQAAERRVRGDIDTATAAEHEASATLQRLEARADDITRAQALLDSGARAGADPNELWRLQRQIAEWQERVNAAHYQLELRRIELRRALGRP